MVDTSTTEQLQETIRQHEAKIKELRADLDEAHELIDQMREQIEDSNATFDNWIEAFDMVMNEKGEWTWHEGFLKGNDSLQSKYGELLKNWNRFVSRYNAVIAPRPIGRPLAASEAQTKEVNRRRKAGESLRVIATAMNLSLATVRTIVGKAEGTDRATKRRKELRRIELDRLRAADYRRRKKLRDGLPARINAIRERGDELVKAAKGIGK
jgi:hypothetical protein